MSVSQSCLSQSCAGGVVAAKSVAVVAPSADAQRPRYRPKNYACHGHSQHPLSSCAGVVAALAQQSCELPRLYLADKEGVRS